MASNKRKKLNRLEDEMVAHLIKDHMEKQGLTTVAFAEELDIPEYTLWRWIHMRASVSRVYYKKLENLGILPKP